MKSGHFRARLPVFCMGEGNIFVNNLSVVSIFPTGFVCTSVGEILSCLRIMQRIHSIAFRIA